MRIRGGRDRSPRGGASERGVTGRSNNGLARVKEMMTMKKIKQQRLNLRLDTLRVLSAVERHDVRGGLQTTTDNTMKSDCCSVFDLCGGVQ
jgi:hypothetical protein